MSQPWLIFDSTYMAHRALHSLGDGLSHGDVPTGVIFGYLKDVAYLMEQHGTLRTVHCWDHGRGRRRELYAGYKLRREEERAAAPPAERAIHEAFRAQCRKLRDSHLRRLGFTNVFSAPGFEGDDIIAAVCNGLQPEDEAIIVSCDQDLWQLLREGVQCYNPVTRRAVTLEGFRAAWGLEPPMWAHVKALAGCTTDEVPGVVGVGEKTAAKYYRGQLKPTSAAYRKIQEGLPVHNRNIQLVRLPLPGTPRFEPVVDGGPCWEAWRGCCRALGMQSLLGMFPGAPRGVRPRHPNPGVAGAGGFGLHGGGG